jgi:hypothetical protein
VKYRKKPTLTDATQWFKNGDHPDDKSESVERPGSSPGMSEGQVVRHFRSLNIPGGRFCPDCGNVMQKHGVLLGLNGEETVCPGDYIVTNHKGQYYVLKPEAFEAMYEPYEPTAHSTPKAKAKK